MPPKLLYVDPDKEKSRASLFGDATRLLQAAEQTIPYCQALILVDGRQDHARDVDVLTRLGWRRENIHAVARVWSEKVRDIHYGGVKTIEDDLAHYLSVKGVPFHLAYLDFCKPFGNERSEHHFSVLASLFACERLEEHAALITNSNLSAYWQDPVYNALIRAYAAPDFLREGSVGMISVRAMSWAGWNFMGDLFAPDQRPDKGDEFLEQKVLTVMCYVDNIIRDIAEVFVPAKLNANVANLDWLKVLDEPAMSNVPVEMLPESLRTKRCHLVGRMARSLGLIDGVPKDVRDLLKHVIGNRDILTAFACMSDLLFDDIPLRNVYSLRGVGGYPYPHDEPKMLPIIWKAEKKAEIPSSTLWGIDGLLP